MFSETITVYNKYKQDGAEKWRRTVVKGVHWESTDGAAYRKTGVQSDGKVLIVIPCRAKQGGRYVSPKAFAEAEDKNGLWTLNKGDTIVRGESDYEVERTSSELQKVCDETALITSIGDNSRSRLPHWEVIAK